MTDFPRVDGVEHRFVEAGGVRLHVAEAGEGGPLLLVHGVYAGLFAAGLMQRDGGRLASWFMR